MGKGLAAAAALLFWTLSTSGNLMAEDFTGQVIRVIDGDTVEVMHLGIPERVRLHGVDCPEIGQPYGERASKYTTTHTLRKTVRKVLGTSGYRENAEKHGEILRSYGGIERAVALIEDLAQGR